MSKSLIITEKPSVASDIAKALGKVPKRGDHYENEQYVIGWAVGYVTELLMPEDIDKKQVRLLAARNAAHHSKEVRA